MAKVIYDSEQGDILNQYIAFSRVFDEQQKLYPGDRAKAVQETIRICMNNDILKDYLAGEEAAAVMFTFADQKDAMNEALEMERAEGKAEGKTEGENRFAALISMLLPLGRMDDAQRATADKEYREKLYAEFNIQ